MDNDLKYNVYIEGEILPNAYTYEQLMEVGLLDPALLNDGQVYIKEVNESEWQNAKDYCFIYINESGEIVRRNNLNSRENKPTTSDKTKSESENPEWWNVVKFLLCLAVTVISIMLFVSNDIGKPIAMGLIFGSWYWAYHK